MSDRRIDFHTRLATMSLAELYKQRTRTLAAYALWCKEIEEGSIPVTQWDWREVINAIEKRIVARKAQETENNGTSGIGDQSRKVVSKNQWPFPARTGQIQN